MKAAQIGSASNRLLRFSAPQNIHSTFLHDSKKIGIVICPLHIPYIFPLKVWNPYAATYVVVSLMFLQL